MKRKVMYVLLIIALILGCAMVVSCASKPTPPPEAPPPPPPPPPPPAVRRHNSIIIEDATTYTVVKGDTLSGIARRLYDNGYYFPLIMLASDEVVTDMDVIEPDWVLTIPNLEKNLNDNEAREKLRITFADIAELQHNRKWPMDATGMRSLADSF